MTWDVASGAALSEGGQDVDDGLGTRDGENGEEGGKRETHVEAVRRLARA